MDLHELLDAQALEGRDDGLERALHEDGVEAVLIAHRLEDVQLDQGEAVPFAILELLEELALRLVVEVRVLRLLDVAQPDGRVDDLRLHLHAAAHALADGEGHA